MANENPSIAGLQAASKAAADASIREKEESAKPTPPEKPGEGKPPPAKPATPPGDADDLKDLRAHIKSKYNIDLDETEILSRLQQNGNGNGDGKPPAEAPRRGKEAPKPEDISDDAVAKFFEKQKKPNLLATHSENQKKEDFALVREHHRDLIKSQIPGIEDKKVDELINERFLYSDLKGEDNPYDDNEQKLGAYLVKQEAERLRNSVGYQVEGVRNLLHQQAVDEYNNSEYTESIDSFVKTQPKEMVLTLGKSGAIDLGDYPVKLKDETINAVADIMRNPINLLSKFKQNKDDAGFDLKMMYDYLLKAELFDNAIKSTAVDYYSKGVDFIESKLDNRPDLAKIRSADKKNTKKEEQQQAEDFNAKQVTENMGRGARQK